MRNHERRDVDDSSQLRRYYTLAEANENVDVVRRSFDIIMQLRTQAKRLHDRMEANGYPAVVDDEAQVRITSVDDVDMDDEPPPPVILRWAGMLRAVYAALHTEISDIQATGGVIKDIETGFVDWPAVHGGRAIWLCWRYGEIEIAHWHEDQAQSCTHRPLSELEIEDA
ncbi:MAG: DUF2203 domain-containing protein [Deltaproteobacteria bacterium]|nr:DUF2203 domain-containing protein [Deltaproteobacteria bacterium]